MKKTKMKKMKTLFPKKVILSMLAKQFTSMPIHRRTLDGFQIRIKLFFVFHTPQVV